MIMKGRWAFELLVIDLAKHGRRHSSERIRPLVYAASLPRVYSPSLRRANGAREGSRLICCGTLRRV